MQIQSTGGLNKPPCQVVHLEAGSAANVKKQLSPTKRNIVNTNTLEQRQVCTWSRVPGIDGVSHKLRFVICAALLGAVSGCTTYIERPRAEYPEPPPPQVVQVAPPAPVYVEPPPVEPDVAVQIRVEADFYAPLSPYGRWEVVGPYGRCWIPARVDREWRPYCNGHWERTERGWYWISDEPWAWATYHYGRWDWRPEVGWYWVPQTQWAPAWVSWHRSDGYLGWAPLHPTARFAPSGLIEVDARVIAPRAYVFVEERRFLEPVRPTTVVVNNTTIINKTVNITNIKVVNKTVINEGPQTEIIERASGHPVQAVPAHELRRKAEARVVARQPVPPAARPVQPSPVVRSEPERGQPKAVIASEPKRDDKPIGATPAPATTPQRQPDREPARATVRPVQPSPVVRGEHEGREPKTVIASEPNRAERPNAATPAAVTTPQRQPDREQHKPAQAPAQAKPVVVPRVAIREPAQSKAESHVNPAERHPQQEEKKGQRVAELHPKHEQIAKEHGRTNQANKAHGKTEEQPKSPEKPTQ